MYMASGAGESRRAMELIYSRAARKTKKNIGGSHFAGTGGHRRPRYNERWPRRLGRNSKYGPPIADYSFIIYLFGRARNRDLVGGRGDRQVPGATSGAVYSSREPIGRVCGTGKSVPDKVGPWPE
jgi:hypothetical protein